jgi:hypothetical protein
MTPNPEQIALSVAREMISDLSEERTNLANLLSDWLECFSHGVDPDADLEKTTEDAIERSWGDLATSKSIRDDLHEAQKMVIQLMSMREWGAATGALYDDPAVKKARKALAV